MSISNIHARIYNSRSRAICTKIGKCSKVTLQESDSCLVPVILASKYSRPAMKLQEWAEILGPSGIEETKSEILCNNMKKWEISSASTQFLLCKLKADTRDSVSS